MGVDVDAEVMIGVWFSSQEEVKSFVEKYYEEVDSVWELPESIPEQVVFLEYTGYSDRGGCLGMQVGEDDLREGRDTINLIYQQLREFFPKESHNNIKPHIWARYW